MKITRVETIWFQAVPEAEWRRQNPNSRQALPNNLWVQIHTDDGLVSLGIKAMKPWPFVPFRPTLSGPAIPPFWSAHGFAGGVLATRSRLPHWQEVDA